MLQLLRVLAQQREQQELAQRRSFSSLLLAQHQGKGLVYKGKVGTGFDQNSMAQLVEALAPLARDAAPLEVPRIEARGALWVEPKLVAEVAFAEFTAETSVECWSCQQRSSKAATASTSSHARSRMGCRAA